MEVFRTAVALMVRSMVLSAQSAGQQRLLWLQQSAAVGGEVGEVARLRDENRLLKWENRLLKARDADAPCRKRYSPLQRLQILWHMEYYRIPRSRVKEHFLIAKSPLYRAGSMRPRRAIWVSARARARAPGRRLRNSPR